MRIVTKSLTKKIQVISCHSYSYSWCEAILFTKIPLYTETQKLLHIKLWNLSMDCVDSLNKRLPCFNMWWSFQSDMWNTNSFPKLHGKAECNTVHQMEGLYQCRTFTSCTLSGIILRCFISIRVVISVTTNKGLGFLTFGSPQITTEQTSPQLWKTFI